MIVLNQPILFVEDDDQLRLATSQTLKLAGHLVHAFSTANAALAHITGAFDGAIVSDIRMPGMDGLQLLGAVQTIDPDIPLILVTGHGDVQMAVNALKGGAYDFISKPFASEQLLATVGRALERRALQVENRRLRAASEAIDAESPLIGTSLPMARLRSTIRQLAAADVDVLVEGETGVGKEVVAHLLHRLGPRAGKPFIAVNCADWSDSSFELSLFGHATDAVPHSRLARTGHIAASSGGTLLLDEIDSMPPAVQSRLLRVLEEREVQPFGVERPVPVDLHIVATSKIDLEQAVAEGRFRPDLFYRLAMTRLRVPPLRDRESDAILLFDIFIEEAKAQLGKSDFRVSGSEMRRLEAYRWPGNVRELRNYAFSAVLGQSKASNNDRRNEPSDLRSRVAAFEADAIREAVRDAGGKIGIAIKALGLPRKTFYDRVTKLKINLSELRGADASTEIE